MTRRHRASNSDLLTGDMFAIPRPAAQIEGSMDYRPAVSSLLSRMLADADVAGIDRYEVAARASRLSGKDVSKNMLDGYTSVGREDFNIPMWLSPVIEVVCDSTLLTDWNAGIRGGLFLAGAATLDAEIGRLTREADHAAEEIKRLRALRKRAR